MLQIPTLDNCKKKNITKNYYYAKIYLIHIHAQNSTVLSVGYLILSIANEG